MKYANKPRYCLFASQMIFAILVILTRPAELCLKHIPAAQRMPYFKTIPSHSSTPAYSPPPPALLAAMHLHAHEAVEAYHNTFDPHVNGCFERTHVLRPQFFLAHCHISSVNNPSAIAVGRVIRAPRSAAISQKVLYCGHHSWERTSFDDDRLLLTYYVSLRQFGDPLR